MVLDKRRKRNKKKEDDAQQDDGEYDTRSRKMLKDVRNSCHMDCNI